MLRVIFTFFPLHCAHKNNKKTKHKAQRHTYTTSYFRIYSVVSLLNYNGQNCVCVIVLYINIYMIHISPPGFGYRCAWPQNCLILMTEMSAHLPDKINPHTYTWAHGCSTNKRSPEHSGNFNSYFDL